MPINSVKCSKNLQLKSTNQNRHICTNNVETKSINVGVQFHFLHILHVQTVPFQFFISLKNNQVFWRFYLVWQRVPKPLVQGISNFLFQILLDSTLEFLDSVLYFSRVERFGILRWKMSFMKLGLIILSFENFNTKTTIVRNIQGAVSWLFK